MNRDLQIRKCSHCGQNGHNSRTCNNGKVGFKLFGVQINLSDKKDEEKEEESVGIIKKRAHEKEVECMRKSKSMDNLARAYNFDHDNNDHDDGTAAAADGGYQSDGLLHTKSSRKKALPWTTDEHRSFLTGLQKLGKGDWKGISKNYVPSKTPTQVASHAQKYFIRMSSSEKKKRRHSVFDISFKEPTLQTSAAPLNDKAAEASQLANSSVCGASSSEKPPLSPMAQTHVPNICHVPFMYGVPGQSVTAPTVMPREVFPMVYYPYSGYHNLPSNENFAGCAPFVNQISNGLYFGPFPQAGPTTSLARNFASCALIPNQNQRSGGPVTSDGKNDSLEASIGALSF